jgi:hypothetical protein
VLNVAPTLVEAFEDFPWTRGTVDPADHKARLASLQRIAIDARHSTSHSRATGTPL